MAAPLFSKICIQRYWALGAETVSWECGLSASVILRSEAAAANGDFGER